MLTDLQVVALLATLHPDVTQRIMELIRIQRPFIAEQVLMYQGFGPTESKEVIASLIRRELVP